MNIFYLKKLIKLINLKQGINSLKKHQILERKYKALEKLKKIRYNQNI